MYAFTTINIIVNNKNIYKTIIVPRNAIKSIRNNFGDSTEQTKEYDKI